jgi:hypothetical protein
VIVDVLVLLLLIVYIAPVCIIAYVSSEDSLRNWVPFIDSWCEKSELFTSLVDLLQPAAVLGLMMLLPPILTFAGVQEGIQAMSWNQMRTLSRYFLFQIIHVFLVTTIAGSILDCITKIWDSPSAAFSLLGDSLPKVSGFFMSYIVIKVFTGLGIEIIRFAAWFVHFLKVNFTPHQTARDKDTVYLNGIREIHNPGWFPIAKIYAQDLLVVAVCMTYAVIAPLIITAGIAYFLLAHFVYKHQMLYVYEPIFETGGQFWPKVFRRYVFALFIAQATLIGMFVLKSGWHEIWVEAILMILTYAYKVVMRRTYETVASALPLDVATTLDVDAASSELDNTGVELFVQPALRAPPFVQAMPVDKSRTEVTI